MEIWYLSHTLILQYFLLNSFIFTHTNERNFPLHSICFFLNSDKHLKNTKLYPIEFLRTERCQIPQSEIENTSRKVIV